MNHRCFSDRPIQSDAVVLGGPEAHHLLHVLRLKPGDHVTLFDGSGWEFDAQVTACARSEVELTITGRQHVDRELPFEIVLGVPLPKGDRQRWLVEKAVELGVTRLTPLITERSEGGKPGDKLHRYVIEASKQCGRNRLMVIEDPISWANWLELPRLGSGETQTPQMWVAHPGAPSAALEVSRPTNVFLAVGPEGGLTDHEVAAAVDAGWRLVGLGPRILRIETAVLALAALFGSTATAADPPPE